MKCQDIENLILSDYLDGEGVQEVAFQVKSHIQECSSCKNFYEEVVSVTAAPFDVLPVIKAPQTLWERIEEKIDSKTGKIRKKENSEISFRLKGINAFGGFLRKEPAFVSILFIGLILFSVFSMKNKSYIASRAEIGHQEEFHYIFSRTRIDLREDEKGFGTILEKLFL